MNGREGPKNKGEPTGPPLFIFEPWRGARVGSHRCPILRPGYRSLAQTKSVHGRNNSNHVTVLVRCRWQRIPTAPGRLEVSPWPGLSRPGVILIMERPGRAWDGRIDFIGVGQIEPERGRQRKSAGPHERMCWGTVAQRKERPTRPRRRIRNDRTLFEKQAFYAKTAEKNATRT